MKFLNEEEINERAVELFNEASKIKDVELMNVANSYVKEKIQRLREASEIFEDGDFWYELVGQAEGDEEFMRKIELLKIFL